MLRSKLVLIPSIGASNRSRSKGLRSRARDFRSRSRSNRLVIVPGFLVLPFQSFQIFVIVLVLVLRCRSSFSFSFFVLRSHLFIVLRSSFLSLAGPSFAGLAGHWLGWLGCLGLVGPSFLFLSSFWASHRSVPPIVLRAIVSFSIVLRSPSFSFFVLSSFSFYLRSSFFVLNIVLRSSSSSFFVLSSFSFSFSFLFPSSSLLLLRREFFLVQLRSDNLALGPNHD